MMLYHYLFRSTPFANMMRFKSNRLVWTCCLLAEFSSSFTITTFNILAPVHRSMYGHYNRRESEDERWWRPRAEAVAKYISENLVCSKNVSCNFALSNVVS